MNPLAAKRRRETCCRFDCRQGRGDRVGCAWHLLIGRCGAFGICGRMVLQEVLSVRSVSKAYPGATALQDVSLSIRPGEIRGLCGENGAGKSTLVNILMGIVQPDSGSIAINGQTRSVRGPQEAQGLGLGLVAQELSLAPHLSILDNIWLGSAEVPFLHRRAKFRFRAQQALATLGLAALDLYRPVWSRTLGHRQTISIARLPARPP